MSRNLQHFVDNFVKGMTLGNTMVDRAEMREYRKQQLELAKANAQAAAARHADKMGIETRRTAAYEKGIEGKYIKDTTPKAGKAGPAGPSAAQEAYYGEFGAPPADMTPQAAPVNVTVEGGGSTDTPPTTDWEAARGGRIPARMATGGRAARMATAVNAGINTGMRSVDAIRRNTRTPPFNPDAGGTTGPGSGYGAIATAPPSMSGTGETYRRGGPVRHYQEGGEVLPPYERPYWSRDAYPWQGPDPATGRDPDAYYDPPYPTDRPPMNRDQSPDRYYPEDPGYAGRAANRDVDRRFPPEESPPLTGREFPYVYPPNSYQGELSPRPPARPGSPTVTSTGGRRAQPRRAADPSSIQSGSTFLTPSRMAPGAARDVGLAEEPGLPPTSEDFRERPATSSGAPGSPEAPAGPYSDDEAGYRPGPLPGSRGDDEAGYRPGPLPTRSRGPDPELQPQIDRSAPAGAGAGAGAAPGAPGAGRGASGGTPSGGAGRGGGRGAISTGWKPLADQTRDKAFDPTKDLYDPQNVHQVDSQGAVRSALEGAVTYGQHVNNPRDPKSKVALYSGHGAADPKLMQQIFQKVDPDNRMSMDQKMEAAVAEVHGFYSKNGDRLNADKSAFEVAQFGVAMSREHGKEALKQLQSGNAQAAVDTMIKGYNFLPDGKTASAENGQLVIRDASGQQVAAHPLDQKALTNILLGMASGELGWDVIREGGSVAAGPPPGPPGGAPMSPTPQGPPGAATPPQGAAQPAAATAGPRPTPAASSMPPGAKTHDGFPARQNPDGSYSTEVSITVTDPRLNGGRPTNIPSLWGGNEVSQDQAVDNALKSGKQYQSFDTIPAAEAAAVSRSAAGGAAAPTPQPSPPTPLAAGPGQPASPPVAAPGPKPPAVPAGAAAPEARPAGETKKPTPGVPSQGDAEGKAGFDPKVPTTLQSKTPEEMEQEHYNKNPFGAPPGTYRESPRPENAYRRVDFDAEAKQRKDKLAADLKRNQIMGSRAGARPSVIAANAKRLEHDFEQWKKDGEAKLKYERDRQDKVDEREVASLKPRELPHPTTEGDVILGPMSQRIDTLVGNAQKPADKAGVGADAAARRKQTLAASPLSWAIDPEDKAKVNDLATGIWRYNHGHTVNKSVDDAVLLTSVIGKRPNGEDGVGLNRQQGNKATTFKRLQNDPTGAVVLQLPGPRIVRMDSNSYTALVQLQQRNWEQHEESEKASKKSADIKTKAGQAIETLTPDLSKFKLWSDKPAKGTGAPPGG